MNRYRDAVFAVLGLVLGVAAMAATVATDEYAHAALAEARGVDALLRVVAHAPCPPQGPAALLAINEVNR